MQHYREWMSGQRRGVAASCLRAGMWSASRLYSLGMAVRNLAYQRKWWKINPSPLPIISVGNLTVGGTGKTPVVAMIARWLRDRGHRVAIVSRGYGALDDGANDEAKELEMSLPDVPHLQSPDRLSSVRIAHEELGSQIVILDDGFQHRKLHRDLDIVLLDALNPFGYGHLLPRGLLREPVAGLQRADVVVVTRCDQVDSKALADIRLKIQRVAPKAAWVETEHRPVRLRNASGKQESIAWLSGRQVLAFCGLGNPEGFLNTLKQQGAMVIDTILFGDHHHYTASDIQRLADRLNQYPQIEAAICTGKDLPKVAIDLLQERSIWSLDIAIHVRFGIEALEDHLRRMETKIAQDLE